MQSSLFYFFILVSASYETLASQCAESYRAAGPSCLKTESISHELVNRSNQEAVAHTKLEMRSLYRIRQSQDEVLAKIPERDSTSISKKYMSLLKEKPKSTKSITAALLSWAGDTIAQRMGDSGEKYDIKRGAFFLTFGALYTGLFQHIWFGFLSKHIDGWGIKSKNRPDSAGEVIDGERFFVEPKASPPPSSATIAVVKLLINQLGMVPFFYMPLFLGMTGAMKNLNLQQTLERGKALFLPLLKRNYLFWLPMQFIQFLVIPDSFQISFLSLAGLCWTVILSSCGGSVRPK